MIRRTYGKGLEGGQRHVLDPGRPPDGVVLFLLQQLARPCLGQPQRDRIPTSPQGPPPISHALTKPRVMHWTFSPILSWMISGDSCTRMYRLAPGRSPLPLVQQCPQLNSDCQLACYWHRLVCNYVTWPVTGVDVHSRPLSFSLGLVNPPPPYDSLHWKVLARPSCFFFLSICNA